MVLPGILSVLQKRVNVTVLGATSLTTETKTLRLGMLRRAFKEQYFNNSGRFVISCEGLCIKKMFG